MTPLQKNKKRAARAVIFALAVPYAVIGCPLSQPYCLMVQAEELDDSSVEDTELKKNIDEAVSLLESVFNKQYEKASDEIKTIIKEKGYDYELTEMSFYDNENPFKSVDYTKLIATYSVIKRYYQQNSLSMEHFLSDAQFLNYTLSEKKYSDGAVYGEIKLSVEDPDFLYSYFKIPDNASVDGVAIKKACKSYEEKIDAEIFGVKLNQTVFISTKNTVKKSNYEDTVISYLNSINITKDRANLIRTALSLQGKVPYEWGGKASKAGIDNTWWLFDAESNTQKGLDCSGFVQWSFITAGFDSSLYNKMQSTTTTVNNLERISKSELQPGDLGLFNDGTLGSNHIGIYLGNGYWIHCSSSANTVIIAQNIGFNVFVRALDAIPNYKDGEVNQVADNSTDSISSNNVDTSAQNSSVSDNASEGADSGEDTEKFTKQEKAVSNMSEEDINLIAKLVQHEAGGENVNGWVAVTEVVLNRINSPKFGDTVQDVVYQKGQFSGVSAIASIKPRQEIVDVVEDVVEGNLSILGNSNVLYFRNPKTCAGIAATTDKDWGNCEWYMAVGAHAFYTG